VQHFELSCVKQRIFEFGKFRAVLGMTMTSLDQLSGYGNIQRMELWRGKQSEIQWQVWIFAPTIDDVESCLWMNG
jgi:hypothetical protein